MDARAEVADMGGDIGLPRELPEGALLFGLDLFALFVVGALFVAHLRGVARDEGPLGNELGVYPRVNAAGLGDGLPAGEALFEGAPPLFGRGPASLRLWRGRRRYGEDDGRRGSNGRVDFRGHGLVSLSRTAQG
jgi:hypothetical protein